MSHLIKNILCNKNPQLILYLNRITSVYWDCLSIPNGLNEHFIEQLVYNNQTGNIDQITREFGVQNFSYDSIDQLTGYSFTSNNSVPNLQNQLLTRSHQYDRTGNRISDSMNGTGSFLANTILSDSVYNYSVDPDARGNRTARTNLQTNATETYAYREDGKEVRYDNQNQTAEYFFDALGRRVAKRFTNKSDNTQFTQTYLHVSDQDKILMGKNGNGDLTVYLDGQNVDEHFLEVSAQGAKAYISDHLGSILNTDAAGSVHGFSPWGERLNSTQVAAVSFSDSPVAYGFTGREYNSESNDIYFGARIYDQNIGRFPTQDPIGFNGGDFNLNRYVAGNPLLFTDPFGLTKWPIKGQITSSFGPRINPTTGQETIHKGIDIGTDKKYGAPVGASDTGIVTQSGTSPTGEGRVTIVQSNGMSQTYRDIDPSVSLGQTVFEGSTVGSTSPFGAQTGAHLHFETKIGGVPFDPLTYLPEGTTCP